MDITPLPKWVERDITKHLVSIKKNCIIFLVAKNQFSLCKICTDSRPHLKKKEGPYAIEDVAIWVDPHIHVGHDDLVLLRLLLISEKCVRHPHFGRVGEREVVELA